MKNQNLKKYFEILIADVVQAKSRAYAGAAVASMYAALIYALTAIEAQAPGSSIQNWGDAVWYSIVTLATVGYGDKFPVTFWGKIIGSFFVVSSLFLLTTIISHFSNVIRDFREKTKMGVQGTDFQNHIIIHGWDSFAYSITKILLDTRKVAVVVHNKEDMDSIYDFPPFNDKSKFFAFYSSNDDPEIIYESTNMEHAQIVYINSKTDTEKLIATLNFKSVSDKRRGTIATHDLSRYKEQFIVTLDDSKFRSTFETAGVKYVISKESIASMLIASYIFEPQVADFSLDIMAGTDSNDTEDFDIQQFKVTKGNPMIGKQFSALPEYFKANGVERCMAMGISKRRNGVYEITKLPPEGTLIDEDDYLILLLNHDASTRLESKNMFNVQQGV